MATNLTATLAIKALDETGEVPQAVAAKFSRMAAQVRRFAAAPVGALRSMAGGVERADKVVGRLQGTLSAIAPIAGAAAAYEGMRGISGIVHGIVRATADGLHETLRAQAAGFSSDEIQRELQVSLDMSERYKQFTQTQVQHMLRNLRSIGGTFADAAQEIEPMLKLRTIAAAARPGMGEEIEQDFDMLAKALEMRGVSLDPARMGNYADAIARSINVFGDTLKVGEYYDLIRYGREAALGWNKAFLTTIAPSLAQRQGGGPTGRSLDMAFRELVGGKLSQPAVQALAQWGLIKPESVIRTRTGSVKGVGRGGVVGADVFEKNPYQWVQDIFLPALKAHGITSQDQIIAAIGRVFAARAGAPIAYMALQGPQFQKDIGLLQGAPGLAAADMFQKDDLQANWAGLSAQLENFARAIGTPLGTPLAHGLHALTDGIIGLERHFGALSQSAQVEISSATATATALGGLAIATKVLTLGLSGTAAAIGRVIPVLGMLSALPYAAKLAADAGKWAQDKFGNQQTVSTVPGVGWVPGANTSDAIFPHYTVGDIAKRLGMPEVRGSADLNVNVQVEPSDSFVSRIVSALRNDINVFAGGGTAGSTGMSMPEAVPGP